MTSLSREARVRYARQIALPEIGERGQLRLSQTRVAAGSDAAALYLERAGLGLDATGDAVPEVRVGAREPALREAAAFLGGALAAVEAIKAALALGAPLELPADFHLDQEQGP